ncbi:MAG: CRISPR-associated endoribonuclease Cas6 [Clostridia bacterium]|nr:CRISPR-associated endoribonuclease Cas6 [Clostridia bacterium]
MQLILTFSQTDGPVTLSLASSWMLQGLLYHALSSDPGYSDFLHNQGYTDSGRRFKLFGFSELQTTGRYCVNHADRTITYFSDITLEVRSIQPYFIGLLFSHFSSHPTVRLGDNTVTVRARLGDDHIFTDRIRVRTLSPAAAYRTEENGYTTYFSPEEERFYRAVEAGARRKWRSYYGNDDGFSVIVEPAEDCRFVCRKTKFKSTFITAWHGEFILAGNAQTLDFLYQTGIGSKNSEGFGLVSTI